MATTTTAMTVTTTMMMMMATRLLGQERCCHQCEQVAREVHGGGLQHSLLFTCGKHNEWHCSEPFEV